MGKSKKELDRDTMFRKIMPALADNPFSSPISGLETEQADPNPNDDSEQTETALYDSETATSVPTPQLAYEDTASTPPISEPVVEIPLMLEDDEEDDLSVLRARLFARSELHQDQVSTINLMESMVLRYLDEVIQRFNCCRCDRCRRDIAAYALNHLPPQYIVADAHHIEEIEQHIPKKMIFDALVKAVLQVRTCPRH